jgi:hypothetical protein
MQHDNKAMVFRVEDGRARLREVSLGRLIENGSMEVRSGLAPGDEVVIYQDFYRHSGELTSSLADLRDGDLVDVNWRKWARRE